LAVLLALGMFVGCNTEEEPIPEIHPSIQGDWVEATWGYDTNLPTPQNASNAVEWYVPGQQGQAARYMFGPRDLVTFAPGNTVPASTKAGLTYWDVLVTNYDDKAYDLAVAATPRLINALAPREWIMSKDPRVRDIITSGDSHFIRQMYQPPGNVKNDEKIGMLLDATTANFVKTWKDFPDLKDAQHVIDGEITIYDFASGVEIGIMYFLLAEMDSRDRREDVMHIYAIDVIEGYTGNYPTTKGAYVRPNRTDPNGSTVFTVDVNFTDAAFVVGSLNNTPSVISDAAGALFLRVTDPLVRVPLSTGLRINEIDRSKFTVVNMTVPTATLSLTEVLKGPGDLPVGADRAGGVLTCRYSLLVTGRAATPPADPPVVPPPPRTNVLSGDVIKITVEQHTNGVYYFPEKEIFITLP
jgi:hypothetical protein